MTCDANSDLIGQTCVARPACDGVTDDTAALQRRIDLFAGQALTFPAGGTCMIRGLNIPSNTHLTINATLKLLPNSITAGHVSNVLTLSNTANVTIDGSGTLDGNRSNQNGPCCAAGVESDGGSNLAIRGLTIRNVKNWPVNIVAMSGAVMNNLTALNSGNSVEFAAGTTNCTARGLRIDGISDMGFAFYGGVSNCSLYDSVISNNASDGVTVLNDGAQSAVVHDIYIENVESFNNQGASGISIASNPGGTGSNFNVTFVNFRSHDNGRSDVFNPSGTNVVANGLTTRGKASVLGKAITNASPNPGGVVSTSVIGNVDGIYPVGNGDYVVGGWACTLFSADSISVDLYFNASAGQPGAIGYARFPSGVASEPAVASACKSTGSAYRFRIPLPASVVNQHHGQAIFVHGISPWYGFSNNVIAKSGAFTVP